MGRGINSRQPAADGCDAALRGQPRSTTPAEIHPLQCQRRGAGSKAIDGDAWALRQIDGLLFVIERIAGDLQPADDEWDLDHEWCNQTCDQVVEMLARRGVRAQRTDGAFVDGHHKVHSWLTLPGATIIDPTVSQFLAGGPCPYGTVADQPPGMEPTAIVPAGHPFARRYVADHRF